MTDNIEVKIEDSIFEELTNAFDQLEGNKVLDIARQFIDSNPDEDSEIIFMNAAKAGIDKVVHKFETGKYSVGDLINAKQILTEIMEMLLPDLDE